MNILFLVLAVVAAASAQQVAQDRNGIDNFVVKVCEPRKRVKLDCNLCRCSALGHRYFCTKMLCKPTKNTQDHQRVARSAEEKICEPGTTYYDYCNVCTCSADGKYSACTKKYCDEKIFNEDGTLKQPNSDLTFLFFS